MLNGFRKAAQDEHAACGKLAGVFGRRIVARRQGVREHFDEAGTRLGLEAAQHLLFARRDEAGNRNGALPGLFDDGINGFAMLPERELAGEPHRDQKRRGEQSEIAERIPATFWIERVMADIGVAKEAIGVAGFPKGARGIELDVAANGGKLARFKGEDEPEAGRPTPWRQGDGGSGAPEPCLWKGCFAYGSGAPEPRLWKGRIWVCGARGRLRPRGFGKLMDPINNIKRGVLVVIHDQEQVDVIGHDYEIGSGEGGIGGVLALPHGDNAFARRSESDGGIVIKAGKNLGPLFDTERDEEEFAT